MTRADPNINALWARVLIDEFARLGLRHACVSPGSRSTPLVLALASHPQVEDLSIVDERAASFQALGLAQVTRRPVVLVCTSGTAAANYLPAICEADASGVPLIVLTADRPQPLRDAGASQAMDQLKLYGDRVRWFHELAQPEFESHKLRYLRSTADYAWDRACGRRAGPVHLNLPFRKPLEPTAIADGGRDSVPRRMGPDERQAVDGRPGGAPWTRTSEGRLAPPTDAVCALAERLVAAERPLILAGADVDAAGARSALAALADALAVPVLAEPTSRLRYGSSTPNILGEGSWLAASGLYEAFGRPDLIVRLGRAPLLWSLQGLVDDQVTEQVAVTADPYRHDPEHRVCWKIVADPARVLEEALAHVGRLGTGQSGATRWLEAHRQAAVAARGALASACAETDALVEPAVWWALGRAMPSDAAIFVSNSMPVRDLDAFLPASPEPLEVFFNRGINGIDGVVSTGLGVARGRVGRGPTVIVTGDVALAHDIGALAAAEGVDATLVVIDNGGGGIFEHLPIAENRGGAAGEVFERHFITPQRGVVERVRGFGVPVAVARTGDALREAVAASFAEPGVQAVIVPTDRRDDLAWRRACRQRITAAIARNLG